MIGIYHNKDLDGISSGEIILSYQKKQNEIQSKNSFEAKILGLRAICLNTVNFNSMAFDNVYNEENHDLMITFQFNGKNWKFSLYSTKDEIDCSEIAKKFNGGGHKKASGFIFNGLLSEIFDK